MKRWAAVIVVLGIALATLGMKSWFGREDSLTASGTLEARNINVGSKVGGRVARVNVLEGDHIQPGQVLLTFEDSELNGRLVSAQGKYEEAKANYYTKRCCMARVPRTLPRRVVPPNINTTWRIRIALKWSARKLTSPTPT